MTMNDSLRFPRLKLGLLLFLAGMLGVGVLSITVLPQVLGDASLPVPSWLVLVASITQSGVLVALVVWAGTSLAPKVGLGAPAFEAAVNNQSVAAALRPQLPPGILGGLLGGLGLFAVGGYAPAEITDMDQPFTVPLLARVLYGGITEELLLRWGLMTLLVWMAWRLLQRRIGTPKIIYIWLAIVVSALLFGAGHLPAAAAQVEMLTTDVTMFIVGANTVFGILFGYLFWRYGLETAMIAHALAHVVSSAISVVVA
ncbi:CPBP family intramembrane glutamic endopeptidase [Alloalcanivorax sp. C16-2]|uniref:CPBP family intramembrane glutamic endopeptidase n=1 Tax=Alloalcanivorax sp. C16-2 TaxID=3390052 RepID=UPI003970B8C9